MQPIYISFLNRLDIEELRITDAEILAAVEASLAIQGRGEAVIEPRMHLEPGVANGHFMYCGARCARPLILPV